MSQLSLIDFSSTRRVAVDEEEFSRPPFTQVFTDMPATTTFRLALPSGETLAADLSPPSEGRTWAVFCHGFGSDRHGTKAEELYQHLTASGAGFVRFDFRGHGESDGAPEDLMLERQIEDLSTVVGAVRSQDPSARIVLIGSSLGGLTAAWFAARHPEQVQCQVLLAPAFRAAERVLACLSAEERQAWRRDGIHRFERDGEHFALRWKVVEEARRHSFEDLIDTTSIPTWIVHGRRDETVPAELSQRFAEEAHSPRPHLDIVDDGDHGLHDHIERIFASVHAAMSAAHGG